MKFILRILSGALSITVVVMHALPESPLSVIFTFPKILYISSHLIALECALEIGVHARNSLGCLNLFLLKAYILHDCV